MARISIYNIDSALNPEDKWIGTDGAEGVENGKTKNFTVQGLADYMAQEGVAGPRGIQGIPGNDGLDGIDGTNGLDGDSAYDIWVNNGNTGTEEDFLTSLNASISLTTNNTSGVSTYDPVTGVLNIPEYGIPWLESNATDLTVWNNGKGNIETNTSFGNLALISNTTGSTNSAIGYRALNANTSGGGNTAVGINSLRFNTEGDFNTSMGSNSMANNISGVENTALGMFSLFDNTLGNYNVSIGSRGLRSNTEGAYNTTVGASSMQGIISGSNNTALGYGAGNFAIGSSSNNVYIGNGAGPAIATTQNNQLYIANASGTPLIGGDFVAKAVTIDGLLIASRFKVNSLNTPPNTSSTIGDTGEIRYDSDFIYVCVAPNTWKRSALLSW